ncbi:hypothetical protein VN1270_10060 [Helicobacter pylori]|nr:hypothetical protein VN1270_10060 [Helicobacter pylori]
MKLYNKVQELINESESLKQKNNEVLGLAKNELSDLVNTKAKENLESLKNELSDLVNTKAKENLESLKNEFQGYLNGQLVEMPIIIKKNVNELFNKEALTKEIHNELLSQFDKQAITNALKQELKTEIKTELGNLLSDREYIKESIDNALQEAEKLKALKLAELKALCYLQVMLESFKVQSLQNALMLEADILNNKMKIENEIAYNLKRKELIEEGKLEDEAFKKYIFKII